MRSRGYADSLSAGTLAAGGTLGQMIPPSGALIVFGIIAEQSIGRLFTAAIIPGLTQMLSYLIVIAIIVGLRPQLAPPTARSTGAERRAALWRVSDLLALIALVIGGIMVGWFTPSEAAAVGCVGSFLICLRRKKLTLAALRTALETTLRTSGMIYVVVIGALVFSVFITVTGLAEAFGTQVVALGAGPVMTMILIAVFLLIVGSVLDGLGLMLLTTPILLPIVERFELSPIWFGIFLVRSMEIGFVHPPLGFNLYVIQGIAPDIPLGRIFRGVVPFLAADLLHLLLIILFPALALALPGWLAR